MYTRISSICFSLFIQIPEIIIFVALLAIFIIAYGVANQAIINPYRDLKWENIGPLFYDIIMLPYWQMYGELQLETYVRSYKILKKIH